MKEFRSTFSFFPMLIAQLWKKNAFPNSFLIYTASETPDNAKFPEVPRILQYRGIFSFDEHRSSKQRQPWSFSSASLVFERFVYFQKPCFSRIFLFEEDLLITQCFLFLYRITLIKLKSAVLMKSSSSLLQVFFNGEQNISKWSNLLLREMRNIFQEAHFHGEFPSIKTLRRLCIVNNFRYCCKDGGLSMDFIHFISCQNSLKLLQNIMKNIQTLKLRFVFFNRAISSFIRFS